MTQEKKCFVNPEDISAIRVQCTNCKSASIIPIAKLVNGENISYRMSRTCPDCQTNSGFQGGNREFEDFVYFNVLLGKLVGTMKGRKIEFSFQGECSD